MIIQKQHCCVSIAAVLSLLVFLTTSSAQTEVIDKAIDGADRLIYLAKMIKTLVLTPAEQEKNDDQTKSFEIVAKDGDGKELDVSADDAKKLYKWIMKDKSGNPVEQKGTIERLESTKANVRKVHNILKILRDKSSEASEVEVRLADQYTAYSSVSAKASLGAKPAGMFMGAMGGAGKWIVAHPYWTAAGGAVVVGGGVAIASSGGGESTPEDGTIDVTGTWRGTSADGDRVTMNLVQSGTVISGTIQIDDAQFGYATSVHPITSGSINGNIGTIYFIDSDGKTEGGSGVVNGNTLTGIGGITFTR